jgi:hypothetical protein
VTRVESVVGSVVAHGGYGPREAANIEVVRAFLALPKPVTKDQLEKVAPNFTLRRLGMLNLAQMFEPATDGLPVHGYTVDSFRDRRDEIVDVIAHGDVVWVLFRLRGTHTGEFWGVPESGRALDLLEIGIFRVEGGAVAEGWFMNDELAICRQLGLDRLPSA